MAVNKTYYWLKLKNDFFKQKEIKKLRRMAGGNTYTVIYLKLQLLSLTTGGKLYFDGIEDSFIEELALELDEEVENVKMTILFLQKYKLIEEVKEDEYILPEAIESIGKETQGAQRVRRHREAQKALHCNTSETNCNTEIEKEIEKEIDIEIEKETDKKFGSSSFKEVFKVVEKCGFRVTAMLAENLNNDIEQFGAEWVKEAAITATNRGKINYSYMKGILDNWARDGKKGDKENGSSFKQNSSGQTEYKGTDRSSKPKITDAELAAVEAELD